MNSLLKYYGSATVCLTIIIVAAFIVSGCAQPVDTLSEEYQEQQNAVQISSYVYRITDPEAGVVCYVYTGYEKGGIDCFLISETNLDY